MSKNILPSNNQTIQICIVVGCQKPARAVGMCYRHRSNLIRYGHAIPRRDWSIQEIINSIGWTVTERGCWEWNGCKNELGYGLITITRRGVIRKRVHRLVYELKHNTTLKSDEHILHACDNPPCCNPEHLSVGTHAENIADCIKKGRHWWQTRTHCPNNHDIQTNGSTVEVLQHGRLSKLCVQCRRDRTNRYDRRIRAEKRGIKN